MKKMRLITLALVLLGMTLCHAQDIASKDYEKDMKELLLRSTLHQLNVNNLKPAYMQMAIEVMGSEQAGKAVSEYLENQLKEDLLTWVFPYFQASLTADDVTFLLQQMNSEELKEARKRAVLIPFEQILMMPEVSAIMLQARKGEPYENIKSVDCPESYRMKFYDYLTHAGFYRLIDLMTSQFRAMVQLNTNEEMEAFNSAMGRIEVAMEKNAAIVYLNRSYETVPESDLDILNRYYESEACKKFKAAEVKASESFQNASGELEGKFKDFLQKFVQ